MESFVSLIWKANYKSLFNQVLICLSVLMIISSNLMKPYQIFQRYNKIHFISKPQHNQDIIKPTYLQIIEKFSTDSDSECMLNFKNWTNTQIPKFQLDPNRFLIPVLYNGPNNQMLGFQQSIVLAILLNRIDVRRKRNSDGFLRICSKHFLFMSILDIHPKFPSRTLVLPNFYDHNFQKDHLPQVINANKRLDLSILSKLVPFVSLKEAANICKRKIHTIFNASPLSKRSLFLSLPRFMLNSPFQLINYRANITKSDILKAIKETKKIGRSVWEPLVMQDWLASKYISFPKHSEVFEAIKAFESTDKCTIYYHPFRQLRLKLKNIESCQKKRLSKQAREHNILNGVIYTYMRPPSYLCELAKLFIKDVLDQKGHGFLAVHWRYDIDDFFNYLCRDHWLLKRKEMCENVNTTMRNSSTLAVAIAEKLLDLNMTTLKNVYLAAPPAMQSFINDTSIVLKKLMKSQKNSSIMIYSQTDLIKFSNKLNKSCGPSKFNISEDELSIVEMEVCALSFVFVRSKQSTWTQNVQANRYFLRKIPRSRDPAVLDLIFKNAINKIKPVSTPL